MMENIIIFLLILVLPLAVWRISNLFSDTEQVGPKGILTKLRIRVGMRYDEHSQPVTEPGSFAEALLCIFCNSIWIGTFFTILVLLSKPVALFVALPFALSAVAIFIDVWHRR